MEITGYTLISELNIEHGIFLVQEDTTGQVYVRKTLEVYNLFVLEKLKDNPVSGIPQIHELYETDEGLVIIEEYIQGHNYRELLEMQGTLSESEVKDITLKLCDILERLHTLVPPVIHRDIKPSNVMCSDSGEIILIDLDAAKIEVEGQTHDTQLIGTQGYAAPEQYGFGASTIQTDIYGMGKLMQTLLTGNPEASVDSKCSLKPVIDKCVQISAKDRYQSVGALKKAILQSSARSESKFKTVIIGVAVIIFITITVCALIPRLSGNSQEHITQSFSGTSQNDYSDLSDDSSGGTSGETSISDTSTVSGTDTQLITTSPIGVYSGDYDEKLILADNGLAYYYCDALTYSEPECRWYEENGKIYIELEKLRCTVYAKVSSDDYSKLVFKSDSSNWNTEKFNKIDSTYESYILAPPPSASSVIDVLENGDMEFTIGDIQFTAPKTFLDYGDEFQKHYQVILVDNDVASSYIGACLFFNDVESLRYTYDNAGDIDSSEEFVSQFLDNVSIEEADPITIADINAYTYDISGVFNEGFVDLKGFDVKGKLYRLSEDDSPEVISILMLQTENKGIDDTELFEKILQSAIGL